MTKPATVVVPISLYEIPSQLHHVLRDYKDGRTKDVRDRFSLQVAALLTRFVRDHGECVSSAAGGDWDVITTTPSSGRRSGEHPLEQVIGLSRRLTDVHVPLLRPGPVALKWRQAHDQGFEVTGDVRGRRVLLVDDTFTTGARTQSAASALQLAGAVDVIVIVVGRVMRPEYNAESQELWNAARGQSFDFETCCLE